MNVFEVQEALSAAADVLEADAKTVYAPTVNRPWVSTGTADSYREALREFRNAVAALSRLDDAKAFVANAKENAQ